MTNRLSANSTDFSISRTTAAQKVDNIKVIKVTNKACKQ